MNVTPDTRIAFIYNPLPQFLGFGGYLERGVQTICKTQHFVYGEETEGFDHYFYIDDGPTAYMEPNHRPATFFAIDMVVKPFWYLQPIETYYERFLNFDHGVVSSTATLRWCEERGYPANLIGFAADGLMHRPLDFTKDRDWVAVWHNCEGRVEATNRAYERFPNGQWIWAGGDLYAAYISRGRCALNWLRGDIVNMRVFEVMACRVPLVTTRHRDMEVWGLVENEHYRGYDEDDIDGMLDGIAWCNENLVAAEQMAIRAWQLITTKHLYSHRAAEILEWLGLN